MNTNLFADTLPLTFTDQGQGNAFLLLHGGAGPRSLAGLAQALEADGRVVVPTHPGFEGAPRPDWCARATDLAVAYLALIDRLDLTQVTVIGNSLGGRIACEMALRQSPRLKRMVLLNAVGIEGNIFDPTKVAPSERLASSFHDPKQFAVVPDAAQLERMAKNQEALRTYSGERMYDVTLQGRLKQITLPTVVAWGESDRIVDVAYGRRWAESIPGARFETVKEAGHFPHIERLQEVLRLVRA